MRSDFFFNIDEYILLKDMWNNFQDESMLQHKRMYVSLL